MSFATPIFSMLDDPGPMSLTFREILEIIVRREVESYNQRHQGRRLLNWLSDEEVKLGIADGKVDFGNREGNQADFTPCFEAIDDAIKDGLILVFVDGELKNDLDEMIECHQGSRAMFVRIQTMRG